MRKKQIHKELEVDSIGNQNDKLTPQEEQSISDFIKMRKERLKKAKDKKREKV